MNRSRLAHRGSLGLKRRWRLQRTNAISAAPIGSPGCPLFAFSTASTASMRMVSTDFLCSSGERGLGIVVPFPSAEKALLTRLVLRREQCGAEQAGIAVEHHLHGDPLQQGAHAPLGQEPLAEAAVGPLR